MQAYYKLLPDSDVGKDEQEILEILTSIKNNTFTNDIKLLNYYREVPINFAASIDHVEKGMVEMTVHKLQAVLMQEQKETFLRSAHLHHDVVAKVNRAEYENGIAYLTRFSYVQILADRRAHVRVEVSENIEASFCANQLRLQGRLQNISIGGMAIIAPEKPGLDESVKGEASLSLRGTRLQIPAVLLRVVDDPPQKMFVFQFMANGKSEEIISHFVFQTQSEIIRELKDKIS